MPGQMPRTAAAQPEEAGILWQDDQVEPGQYYNYKARGVGANTFPTEGEYCQAVMVEVLPDIDFRFTLTSRDTVRFEVVKAVGPQGAQKENFWVGVGGEIGGLYTERSTGAQQSYLTGNVLVDFQYDEVR